MAQATQPVIEVENLIVDYRSGRKSHRAVNGITFQVRPGECTGFIGANGAGKSTTMKTLMGFVFPTSGKVEVFGQPAGTVESRQRLGYLPEVALYYPFMKARELLELYGGLQGLTRSQLKERIPPLLEEVGLGGKSEILLKNFSKGMQQRLGIAQAIIASPEVLIFDELSSGLDPVGRHDLREVLLRLKNQGTTIFFSSHELTEVESLCDRVIMIDRGKIVTEADVADLMKPLNIFMVKFASANGELPAEISELNPERTDNAWTLRFADPARYAEAVTRLARNNCQIVATESKTRSLEEYFIQLVTQPEKVAS